MSRDEWKPLLLLIQSQHNNTPFHSSSLICPEMILNPRSRAADFLIPGESQNLPTYLKIKELAESLQKERLSNLELGDHLQRGRQETREPAIGQIVWWYKNGDDKHKGILFGKITEKLGSDYKMDVSTGGTANIPYQRIYLIEGQESHMPHLSTYKGFENDKLKYDIKSNPGPYSGKNY